MQQIDLQKVLLITNSDIAQSGLDAADYIIKRGLNPAFVLSFAFGTNDILDKGTYPTLLYSSGPTCTTSGYSGRYFIPAVAAFCTANSIEAVILSTYTPSEVVPAATGVGGGHPLGKFASLANYIVAQGIPTLNPLSINYFDPFNRTAYWDYTKIIQNVTQNWKPGYTTTNPRNPNNIIPFGRLGNPVTGGTIAEYGVDSRVNPTGKSAYQYAVDTALLGESQNQLATQQGLTTTLKYGDYATPESNQVAYDYAINYGLNIAKLDYSLHTILPVYIYAADPVIPITSATGFPASGVVRIDNEYIAYGAINTSVSPPQLTTLSRGQTGPIATPYKDPSGASDHPDGAGVYLIAPPVDAPGTYYMQDYGQPMLSGSFTNLHSICVNNSFNSGYVNQNVNQLVGKLVNGSWSYVWTSSSSVLGISFLIAGASTAIMTVNEPYAYSIPVAQEIYILATAYQIPLMLAQFLSHAGFSNPTEKSTYQPIAASPTGDPLNNPYKSTPLLPSEVTVSVYENALLGQTSGAVGLTQSITWNSIPGTSSGSWINIPGTGGGSWTNIPGTSSGSWTNIPGTSGGSWTNINNYIPPPITQTATLIAGSTSGTSFIGYSSDPTTTTYGDLTPSIIFGYQLYRFATVSVGSVSGLSIMLNFNTNPGINFIYSLITTIVCGNYTLDLSMYPRDGIFVTYTYSQVSGYATWRFPIREQWWFPFVNGQTYDVTFVQGPSPPVWDQIVN